MQVSRLWVAAGLTPGPFFLCPLAPGSVPYPRPDVTIESITSRFRALHGCPKQPVIARRCPRAEVVTGSTTAGRARKDAPGHRRGAKASSLDNNDPCTPGPAATTASRPGPKLVKPLTSAPASVAISQPAARSQGFRPDS